MSRASTLYASAYDTERLHELRIRVGASRSFTVDMNGAMPADVTISAVAWDASGQSVASLSADSAGARSFGASLSGLNEGNGEIAAVATLSNGDVSVQRISVWVK